MFNLSTTALLLVDIQEAFTNNQWPGNGVIYKRNNPNAEQIAGKLLNLCRQHNMHIIHVKHNSIDSNSLLQPHLNTNQFNRYVQPLENEIVFTKIINSAFIGTNLDSYLKQNNINTLIICGLTTDHCVSTTVRMGSNMGYNVYLVSDACATYDRPMYSDNSNNNNGDNMISAQIIHDIHLTSLHNEFCQVATSHDIEQIIKSNQAEPIIGDTGVSMTSSYNIELYGYYLSSSTHRVRIALNLLNIKYTTKIVNVSEDTYHETDEYKQLNPMSQVPVIKHTYIDQHTQQEQTNIIAQSVAIIEYINELFCSNTNTVQLLPPTSKPHLRAVCRQIVQIIACNIQPLQNRRIMNESVIPSIMHRGLTAVEQLVKLYSGKYCIGDSITMADIYVIPQLQAARRWNINLDIYPTLVRIDNECSKISAFIQAHPLQQQDYLHRQQQ